MIGELERALTELWRTAEKNMTYHAAKNNREEYYHWRGMAHAYQQAAQMAEEYENREAK